MYYTLLKVIHNSIVPKPQQLLDSVMELWNNKVVGNFYIHSHKKPLLSVRAFCVPIPALCLGYITNNTKTQSGEGNSPVYRI